MGFGAPDPLPHLPQLPMTSFIIQRNWTREIRNTHNTRHNEKDCYDSERKTQQDVVGIKEKSTYYPVGTTVPFLHPASRILVAYPRLIPGKAGGIILWEIWMNTHMDIWAFPPTKRLVTASPLQRKKSTVDKTCLHAERFRSDFLYITLNTCS